MLASVGSGGLGQKLPPIFLIGWGLTLSHKGPPKEIQDRRTQIQQKKPKKVIKGPKRGGARKMDPPELASEPPRSRIELRTGVKTFGLGNVRVIFPPQVAQIVVSDHPSLQYHWTPSQYLCHACKQCVRKVKKFKSFAWFYNSKHFTDSKFSKKFAVFPPTYIHDNLLAAGTWV